MKTLSEGAFTDRVLTQMAGTFTTLAKDADFSASPNTDTGSDGAPPADRQDVPPLPGPNAQAVGHAPPTFGSLAYNINIQLPESRDPAVYNAIFKALREHFR